MVLITAGILSAVMRMKQVRTLTAAAVVAAVIFLTGSAAAAAPQNSARSAILLDASSGRVLYAKNADAQSLIASTTKIMTGLLVCEQCDLDATFSIPPEAVGVEGSSLYLREGQTRTVRELLYGLLLHSGNDAAVALAICCDGSVEAFVERMNARALALGLRQTHFENPSGLNAAGHGATARELALLARAAMENRTFYKVVSTPTITFDDRTYTNHNRLLWQYDGAVGVKTGYTRAAGRILVSCAERGGQRLIAVTIDDKNDWRDHAALLDYGFAAFPLRAVLRAGQTVAAVQVIAGETETAELVTDQTLALPLGADETAELRFYAPPVTFAPVPAGEAGRVEVWCGGEKLAERTLYVRAPVARREEKSRFARIFGG